MTVRQDGVESELAEQPWHCAVRSLAGPLPGTGSRRSGHFCPDTKEEEASSPALPSDLFLWVH